MLIPFNFHFMKSYDINVEYQDILVQVLHQIQSIDKNGIVKKYIFTDSNSDINSGLLNTQ